MTAAVLLVGLAQKLRIPYPITLVLGGAGLGFIPGLTQLYLDPKLVFVIVLPPILYYGSFWISFREFKKNLVDIFSLALGLVFATTLAIGILFKWLFPEFPWALAFTFGAIVSPPDAVAAIAIISRFSLSARLVNVLEGESLINDTSGLILYKLGVTALLSGVFSLPDAFFEFLKLVSGGIVVGWSVGIALQIFSRRFLDPIVGIVFSFCTPYISYLLATWLDFSGVLSVVVTGLIAARYVTTQQSSLRRVVGYAVWDVFIILLNCFVFMLIGSQLRSITSEMSNWQIMLYAFYGVIITFTMIAVRMAWVYLEKGIYYIRAKYILKRSDICPSILRDAAVIGWSGMRGIDSLAAALALPFTLPNGENLPGRNVVIYVTFVVIMLTLVIPGLTMPKLIRWLNIHHYNPDAEALAEARKKLAKIAEEEIQRLFEKKKITNDEKEFLLTYFRARHRIMEISHAEESDLHNLELIRIEVLHAQRKALLNMWKKFEIEDKPFSHLERELDLEEEHLARAVIE